MTSQEAYAIVVRHVYDMSVDMFQSGVARGMWETDDTTDDERALMVALYYLAPQS